MPKTRLSTNGLVKRPCGVRIGWKFEPSPNNDSRKGGGFVFETGMLILHEPFPLPTPGIAVEEGSTEGLLRI
jgi:hypothetical protein